MALVGRPGTTLVTAVALVRDLMLASRIDAAAARAGRRLLIIDSLDRLPPADQVSVLLVAWDERGPDWGQRLSDWRPRGSTQPRLVLFGPHTDVEAAREAKHHGIGPMLARSTLLTRLPDLFSG